MSKYKCKICNQISTAEEWNKNTINKLGEPITNIEDSPEFMICPKCKGEIYCEDFEEIQN